MGFDDALCNCCEDNDKDMKIEDVFSMPSLYQYMNAPMLDPRFEDYYSNVDYDVEKTKTGVKVTQVSSPLIPEPKYMGLSPFEPLSLSQQAADQQERKPKNRNQNRPNNRESRSSEEDDRKPRQAEREEKSGEGSHTPRSYHNTPQSRQW